MANPADRFPNLVEFEIQPGDPGQYGLLRREEGGEWRVLAPPIGALMANRLRNGAEIFSAIRACQLEVGKEAVRPRVRGEQISPELAAVLDVLLGEAVRECPGCGKSLGLFDARARNGVAGRYLACADPACAYKLVQRSEPA